jgi:hypothetical protein
VLLSPPSQAAEVVEAVHIPAAEAVAAVIQVAEVEGISAVAAEEERILAQARHISALVPQLPISALAPRRLTLVPRMRASPLLMPRIFPGHHSTRTRRAALTSIM